MSWKRFGAVSSFTLGLGMIALAGSCVEDRMSATHLAEVSALRDDLFAVESDVMELQAAVTLLQIDVAELPRVEVKAVNLAPEARTKPRRRPVKTRRPVCPLFGL